MPSIRSLSPCQVCLCFAFAVAGVLSPWAICDANAAWQDQSSNQWADQKTSQKVVDSAAQLKWFRGNLHTHSLWSDGNDFPEMIVKWYLDHEYDFLSLTDHNILSRGEKWMGLERILERGGDECMEKYVAEFGENHVETRQKDGKTQVRLRALEEFRDQYEVNEKFLLIEGEEISDQFEGLPIHLNATNLEQLLQPTGGGSVSETIDANLRAAAEHASQSGRQVLIHLNHPNFGYAVTAEDLAAVSRCRFFEIYNGHPDIRHLGDNDHPSVERIWDIVNTLRLDKLGGDALYGLGTDDSHNYHGIRGSHPGRGWVMVRAKELTPDALIGAMVRGDFYASSGVELSDVVFDESERKLTLNIIVEEGVSYETKFIGTRRDYNTTSEVRTDSEKNKIRSSRVYSSEVGQVLATDNTANPTYQLTGDELYVRAVVTSSKPHPDPSFKDQFEQVWTQPVGWNKE